VIATPVLLLLLVAARMGKMKLMRKIIYWIY
jgi:hypothetical protein